MGKPPGEQYTDLERDVETKIRQKIWDLVKEFPGLKVTFTGHEQNVYKKEKKYVITVNTVEIEPTDLRLNDYG